MSGLWFAAAYVAVLAFAFSLARASSRGDEMSERMHELEISRWSRLPLYDWSERGDFDG